MALEMGKGGIGREFKAFNCDTPFLPEGLFFGCGHSGAVSLSALFGDVYREAQLANGDGGLGISEPFFYYSVCTTYYKAFPGDKAVFACAPCKKSSSKVLNVSLAVTWYSVYEWHFLEEGLHSADNALCVERYFGRRHDVTLCCIDTYLSDVSPLFGTSTLLCDVRHELGCLKVLEYGKARHRRRQYVVQQLHLHVNFDSKENTLRVDNSVTLGRTVCSSRACACEKRSVGD
jgi:hypothetical protein